MKCREVERRVVEDYVGALTEPAVREHLEQCRSCGRLASELEEIDCLRRALGNRTLAPSDLPVRVARGFSRARTRRSLWQAAVVVSGLLVWSGGNWWLDRPSRPSPAPQVRETRTVPWMLDPSGLEQGQWPASRQQQYLEVVVPDRVEGSVVFRLPTTIEVRQEGPGQDYPAYVSH